MVPRSLWWRRVVLVALVGAALCSDDDDDALAVDCTLGRWGEWSTCVDAQQVRHRDIEIPPRLGGKPCEDLTETQKCSAGTSGNNQKHLHSRKHGRFSARVRNAPLWARTCGGKSRYHCGSVAEQQG